MALLTAARNTPRRGPSLHSVSVYIKDGYSVFEGGAVCIDGTDGYAVPAAPYTGLIAAGIYAPRASGILNQGKATLASGGTDGSVRITLDCGIFDLDNGTGSDAVLQSDVGATCYFLDDHTVSRISSNKSAAGKIMFVNGNGQISVAIGLPTSNVD